MVVVSSVLDEHPGAAAQARPGRCRPRGGREEAGPGDPEGGS